MQRLLLTGMLFALCIFVSAAPGAQETVQPPVVVELAQSNVCSLDAYAPRRPGLGEAPTRVSVGITLIDIIEIDDANQSVGIDIYAIMRWRDPALSEYEGCRVSYSGLWNPELELINSGSLQTRREPFVEIESDGTVRAALRITGSISSPHNIRDFPMDKRVIRLIIFSPRNNIESVVLEADQDWSTRADTLTIGNWEVGDVTATVAPFDVPQLEQTFSRYTLEFPAERHSGYYFYKVLLPLGMITLMAFAVFWIDPRQFAAQLSMAATAVLTLVAFQFSLTELLPTVSYLTRMDQFILGANIAVFAALMESVLIGFLVTHERQGTAIRIDTACRWIFPIAFVIFTIVVFA